MAAARVELARNPKRDRRRPSLLGGNFLMTNLSEPPVLAHAVDPALAAAVGDLDHSAGRGRDRRVARMGHLVEGGADDHGHLQHRRRAAARPVAAQVQGHRIRHGEEPQTRPRQHPRRRDHRHDPRGQTAADRHRRYSGWSSRGCSPAPSPASKRCCRAAMSACCPAHTAGKPQHKFTGQEDPPILSEHVPGTPS